MAPSEGLAPNVSFADYFVGRGLATPEQIDHAMRLQTTTGQRLGEVLVEQGLISRMDVASALQAQWRTNRTPAEAPSTGGSGEQRDPEQELRDTVALRNRQLSDLRQTLAEQQTTIAELSRALSTANAAVADRDDRLTVVLQFLKAPGSAQPASR